LGADADLTTTTDQDFYTFNAPSVTGGLGVTLQRAGLSLVTPQVTVYNAAGQVVASAASTDPAGGDLTIQLSGVAPLGQYYVQVEGAGSDTSNVFRVGSYHLSIQSLPVVNQLLGGTTSTAQSVGSGLLNYDPLHLDSTILTASLLSTVQLFAPTSAFDYAYRASLSDGSDVDYFKVQAPQTAVGDNTLTAMAWGVGSSQLLPRVSLWDAAGKPVPAQVLVNEGGSMTIQAAGVTPSAIYYVKVAAAASGGPTSTGNYFLGVDFGTKATRLTTFVDSGLDATKPQDQGSLTVYRSGLYHYVLSADSAGGTGVQMTISDASGQIVAQLVATAGDAASLTLTLAPGTYTFTFKALAAGGGSVTPVHYCLQGILMSDPIGPQPSDPSGDPSGSTTTSGSTSTSSSSTTSSNDYWYQWNYGSGTTYGGPPPDSSSG
jgi:hypothetical protein